ncbi:TPA: hypothetical protein MB334_003082 [Klebsiella pneumoniae]|nr:hypothetical protein [Klebsiella pneumoniae]
MTDITQLTSVQKNANIHRLSRLIAYAPNDELRQMAVEVEHYTDQLIEALEKAQQRNAELENYAEAEAVGADKAAENSVYWMKRYKELKSRTVTVKLPPKIERNDIDGWFTYKGGRVGGGAAEWYNKALDDVGSELTGAGIKWEAE